MTCVVFLVWWCLFGASQCAENSMSQMSHCVLEVFIKNAGVCGGPKVMLWRWKFEGWGTRLAGTVRVQSFGTRFQDWIQCSTTI